MSDTPTGYIWLQDGADGDEDNGPWGRGKAEKIISSVKRNAYDLGGDDAWVVDMATGDVLAHLKDGDCPSCEQEAIISDTETPLPSKLRWVAFEKFQGEWFCVSAYSTLRKAQVMAVRRGRHGLVWDMKRLRVAWRSDEG